MCCSSALLIHKSHFHTARLPCDKNSCRLVTYSSDRMKSTDVHYSIEQQKHCRSLDGDLIGNDSAGHAPMHVTVNLLSGGCRGLTTPENLLFRWVLAAKPPAPSEKT